MSVDSAIANTMICALFWLIALTQPLPSWEPQDPFTVYGASPEQRYGPESGAPKEQIP